jgi:hypothetical protein
LALRLIVRGASENDRGPIGLEGSPSAAGATIVKRALEAPIREIVEGAGSRAA